MFMAAFIISRFFTQLKEKTFQQIEEVNKSFTAAVHNITSIKSRAKRESVSTEMQANLKVCAIYIPFGPQLLEDNQILNHSRCRFLVELHIPSSWPSFTQLLHNRPMTNAKY